MYMYIVCGQLLGNSENYHFTVSCFYYVHSQIHRSNNVWYLHVALVDWGTNGLCSRILPSIHPIRMASLLSCPLYYDVNKSLVTFFLHVFSEPLLYGLSIYIVRFVWPIGDQINRVPLENIEDGSHEHSKFLYIVHYH